MNFSQVLRDILVILVFLGRMETQDQRVQQEIQALMDCRARRVFLEMLRQPLKGHPESVVVRADEDHLVSFWIMLLKLNL